MAGAYESLVGWRYLLRGRVRPRLLLIGTAVLVVGGALLALGVALQESSGESLSVFGNAQTTPRIVMGIGLGLMVLGGSVSLFGALYMYMTIFSAFSTFMVAIGVAEVILVLGVMNGFQGDLRKKIIDTYAHVVIESAEQNTWLTEYRTLAQTVRQTEGVIGVSPILRTDVMLNAPSNMSAAALVGIDPDTIGETNKLPSQLSHGCMARLKDADTVCTHWLIEEMSALANLDVAAAKSNSTTIKPGATASPSRSDDFMAFPAPKGGTQQLPPALFVGAELRRNLVLWPDEVINIISPFGDLGPEGPIPKSRPCVVGGWFVSGMREFDTKLADSGLPAGQDFMGVGDVASAIQIKVNDLDDARRIRDQLRGTLPPTVRVTDWQDRNRNLFSALKLEKVAMFLVLTINILLAAFSITSTLVMTIIERKREIAIMMAMGATRSSILRIFLSQGAFTGAVGSLLGTSIGLGLGFTLANLDLPLNQEVYYISAIPVDLRIIDVVAIIAVAIGVSVLSTIYPARFAARLKPVEGLGAQ
ncbi:MAG: FtsX-like permease family protein [Myxococcota bacterium]|nr:FtsX-like permease family protein [Myxococcota bacterium]